VSATPLSKVTVNLYQVESTLVYEITGDSRAKQSVVSKRFHSSSVKYMHSAGALLQHSSYIIAIQSSS